MKNRLGYNIDAAIQHRGKTFAQMGWADEELMKPMYFDNVIDFRTSIKMTGDDFEQGNIPFHAEVFITIGWTTTVNDRTMTKKEWKEALHKYRAYLKGMRENWDEPHAYNNRNF
jgi:hypothetical protein